jgi:hypothetical protein
VAQAADPDNHRRRPRFEQRPAALDRMQRGHSRVRQWRGMNRIDVAERHDVAHRHGDVVGHTAVARDADCSREDVAAHVVLPAGARAAPAAAE